MAFQPDKFCFRIAVIAAIFSLISGCKSKPDQTTDFSQWREYLGGPERSHYSSLTQINLKNVSRLKKAWEFNSGDSGQVQCNPIIVDGLLYGVTASNQIFALDAATGKQKWRYKQPGEGTSNSNRGVTYWADGQDKRILYAYASSLFALNAVTGQPIKSFGNNGSVSLKSGLDSAANDKYVISTTPGTLFNDLIIMPLRVSEDYGAARGYVQAFNVKTGKIAWVFKTLPSQGTKGSETWPKSVWQNDQVGAVNSWPGMAIDRKREIIYVPTGSAAFDFYGGNRIGKNLFANCLLALNAATGKLIWYYQFVHHDIWDRDLPAPPNLLTTKHNGKMVDAVAQVTKNGLVFMFNRKTGKPIFPIKEQPFPASSLPGEQTWPTQPVPELPAPFARQNITENEISTFASNRRELLTQYKNANKGTYQPLGFKPTIFLPGTDGGAEWGGAAVDPNGVLYVNANEVAWYLSLSKSKKTTNEQQNLSAGALLYQNNCSGCHGVNEQGNPASGYPSLVNIQSRVPRSGIYQLISHGRGMMPGFANISALQKQAIVDFLFHQEKTKLATAAKKDNNNPEKGPYKFDGYNKFLDADGYPAITPPWGTLSAIDMNTGKFLWHHSLGELKELSAKGIPPTGTENYGGPVVTAGGLLFIAATKDEKLRAFDKKNGKLVWETALPAAGYATPATYSINGKQFIVIACGGAKLGTKAGDSYVAFSLP